MTAMHDVAFFLVLISAIMHAAWNALVKINAAPLLAISAMFGFVSLLLIFYIPWLPPFSLALLPWLGLSLVFHFGYKLYLVKALTLGNFSQTYPIARGSAPLWVLLLSFWLLPEDLPSLNILALFGVVTIVAGIFCLVPWQQLIKQQALFIAALVTGFWIAGYTLVDGYVVSQSTSIAAFVFWLFFLDGVVINLYAFLRHKKALVNVYVNHWRSASWGGACSLAAYGLCLWAMSIIPVVMVSALRETSVLVAVIMARWWLKESLNIRHYTAAGLICAGLIMSKLA